MTTTVEPLPDDVALAYLDHLGLDVRPGAVDVHALRTLQRTHLERVPWETLEIVLGRPPGIDPLASVGRILSGRGGYCYHLNGAFSALLAWLRVDVTRHLAGVYGGRVQEPPGPDGNHLALTVRTPEGGTWLVDVGLGDGPAVPLALAEGEHDQGGSRYHVGPSPFGHDILRFRHEPGGAFVGIDLSIAAAAMAEFEAMHAFLSTQTSFATTVAVQRRVGGQLEILRGCTYTERTADSARSREVTTASEWWELVLDHFGLAYRDLSADERSSLWHRVRQDHDSWAAGRR